MGREQATPLSSGLYGGEGERGGGGGKFRKPPARRRPTTPYDRPSSNQTQAAAQRRDGGWLSKLVDPACRVIAGGANRIFPSFFSKSPLNAASTTGNQENEDTRVEEDVYADNEGCTSNLGLSESTGGTNPSKGADTLNCSSDFDQLGQDKISNLPDSTEFAKIEQLVKGRRFSRDDINRLTEILNSRVADISNVELEEKKPNMAMKREGEGVVLAHEKPRMSTEEKQEGLNRARVGTSMPLLQSAVREEVGASPVDIARAYMGTRVSEVGTDSKRTIFKDDRVLLQSDGYASEPFFPSPSPKSAVCWPGAMVQDQHGYSTPQSVNSRSYGLHYFQRTPYSRTIYSKSKPKLTHSQADKNMHLNTLSTPQLQSQTSLFGQSKGDDVLSNGNGSVGPIRRLWRKFPSEAPPRGSTSSHFSQNGPSQAANSKGFLPAIKKNLETGATSITTEFQSVYNTTKNSELGIPTLQPNPAVRAILEHLDRNKPTPKEKSAELQLATAWKKSSSSKVTDTMLREGTSLLHAEEGFAFQKNTNFVNKESSAQGNDRGNSNFEVKLPERSTSKTTDVNKDTEASCTVNGNHDSQIKCTNETASLVFTYSRQKDTDLLWPHHNQINGQYVANMAPNSAGSDSLKKPPFHPSGTKPILPSISVDKPDLRRTFFSDNSSGFTFPVSTSSGVLSEPPTPSIMPSTSSAGLPQPKEGPAIPSYSFGTKKSTPALVFSFPSTSTASMQDVASNLKFSFGSDKNNRISFSLVEKDGICY